MKKGVIFFCLALLFLAFTNDANAARGLSNYEAQFEVVKGKAGKYSDVSVTLKITYKTHQQALANGYKFVGKDKITAVSVSDEKGAIPFKVEALVENKISYSFPQISSGEKTVIVKFIVPDAIKDGFSWSGFDAEWVGNWKIPVEKSKYTFIFPSGYAYRDISTNFASYREEIVDGRKTIVSEQSPLTLKAVSLKFGPPLNAAVSIPFYLFCFIVSAYLIFYGIVRYSKISSYKAIDNREVSPAEVAYLKKGRGHAVCVAVLDLLQKGALERDEGHKMKASSKEAGLNSYDLVIMGFFRNPKTLKAFFKDRGSLKSFDLGIVNNLSRKGCLKNRDEERSLSFGIMRNSIFSLVLTVALGVTLGVLAQHKAIFGFTVFVACLSFVLSLILLNAHPLSEKGREVLSKYEYMVKNSDKYMKTSREYDSLLSYAVAILGLSILAGTIYDDMLGYVSYARANNPDTSAGCSGCGTGGTSSGGDGGSGGCSGCGGCGG